jgi:hypothetical protein
VKPSKLSSFLMKNVVRSTINDVVLTVADVYLGPSDEQRTFGIICSYLKTRRVTSYRIASLHLSTILSHISKLSIFIGEANRLIMHRESPDNFRLASAPAQPATFLYCHSSASSGVQRHTLRRKGSNTVPADCFSPALQQSVIDQLHQLL